MTIANRLKKLEQVGPEQTADPQSTARLSTSLLSDYERNKESDVNAEWLASQSPKTAIALALHGPLPLPLCLEQRLRNLSVVEGTVGKLSSRILEVAA